MSKEILRADQFRHAKINHVDETFQLSDEQRRELEELYGQIGHFRTGKLVVSKVVNVTDDGVLVDIGYKSQSLIPSFEFSPYELKKLEAGASLEVILDELEAVDGSLKLSYEKAKAVKAWQEITDLFEKGEPVEGVVTHKVKGGLSVDVGIPAFLPGSQIDVHRVNDFDQFIGQTIQALIIKINKKRGNIIVSRRKLLSDLRSEERKKVLDTLAEGQVIQGVVKNITNYGAFVDIGGVDGLLHITDMTWGRIGHPSELIKIGDTLDVKVLSFDKANEKISLGIKQLSENPWEKLPEEIKPGAAIKGKISSITDYGLFVEVAKGVEGLVHISEISWTERINDLHRLFNVGDEIEARVVDVDVKNRRMSLSIKQLSENPWEQLLQKYRVGDKISGSVSNIADFGIFVQIIPGIDGLVHVSDISWTEHIEHPSSVFKRGQEVEAVILSIDRENKKISLGIKQLSQDPWETIEEEYPVGSIVEGEISKITNFGVFVKLPSGIEGLIHKSQFGEKKPEDVLKIGETTHLRVVKSSKDEHKLGLSIQLEENNRYEPAPTHQRERQHRYDTSRHKETAPKSSLQLELEKVSARASKYEDEDDDYEDEE